VNNKKLPIIGGDPGKPLPIEGVKRIRKFRWPVVPEKNGLPDTIIGEEHYYEERKFVRLLHKQSPRRRGQIVSKDPYDGKTKIEEFLESPARKFEFRYNNDFHLKGRAVFQDKTLLAYTEFTNDSDGNILSEIRKRPNGDLWHQSESEYDSYGNRTKYITVSEEYGRNLSESNYIYGESSIIQESYMYVDNKKVLSERLEFIFEENDQKKVLVMKMSKPGSERTTDKYMAYDKHDNLIEFSTHIGGRLLSHSVSTYKYDNKNNWISMKSRTKGPRLKREYLTTREIEYHS